MNRHALSYSSTDQLTADDLRAYRAGQLRGATLHRVERLLLENPFYADALDGLDALQQVGENLHVHTRDLHLALQERVQGLAEETATPRRLMPMWVASAAASIMLVISVAIYYFFYVLPAANAPGMDAPAATLDGIEPGTVLIDANALGVNAKVANPTVSNVPEIAPAAARPAPRRAKLAVARPVRAERVAIVTQPLPAEPAQAPTAAAAPPAYLADAAEVDTDIMPLPISQAEKVRRQTVNTERAFME